MNENLTAQQVWEQWQNEQETAFQGCVLQGTGGSHNGQIVLQQDQREITGFLGDVLKLLPAAERKVALETGLCDGGTHSMWKMMFGHVISVEVEERACMKVAKALKRPESSSIVCGNSSLPGTALVVRQVVDKFGGAVDLLFIDGDHSAQFVESDFLNYEPMVRKGGIVAFHDSLSAQPVKELVDKMENTGAYGKKPVRMAHHRLHFGISYYVKGE